MSLAPTKLDRSYVVEGDGIESSRTVPRQASIPGHSCLRVSPVPRELKAQVHDVVRTNLFRLLTRAREIAAIRTAPRASIAELGEAIPILFDLLLRELRPIPRSDSSVFVREECAFPVTLALTVSQVIHDYVAVTTAITELAAELPIGGTPEELTNVAHCVAEAVAQVQAAYARRRERAVAADAAEEVGNLVHELRNRISTATLAFNLLNHEGQLRGRPAAILQRSLETMTEHIARASSDTRKRIAAFKRELISVGDLLEAVAVVSTAEAQALGLELKVEIEERDLIVEGDSLLIEDAIFNVLRNAFRHTRAHGHVALRAFSSEGYVTIEVADQCGGIPEYVALERLFDRFEQGFEQGEASRTGLGLGLTISRRGVEASGGTIMVRDCPDGCTFMLSFPRHRPSSP